MSGDTIAEKGRLSRRDLVRLGGALALAGSLSRGVPAVALAAAGSSDTRDLFVERLQACRQTTGGSLLSCAVMALPELQVQPRPVSEASVKERTAIATSLLAELAGTPPADVAGTVLPAVVRYPAWIVASLSLELFELVLENSALPAFELHGVAMEHVLPYTALIDLALIPLGNLLRSPGVPFSPEIEEQASAHIESLRGRLRLLGDRSLMAMADTIRAVLSRGEAPTMLRLFVTPRAGQEEGLLRASLHDGHPQRGDVLWQFEASPGALARIGRKNVRAIDKVAASLLIGKLFFRHPR